MINSVIINDKDNVIVAIEPIKKDELVEYKDLDGEIKSLKALDDIKIYHIILLILFCFPIFFAKVLSL